MQEAALCGLGPGMLRPKVSRTRQFQATHLRYLGVSPVTLKLYRHAMHEFFVWRKSVGLAKYRSYGCLDEQLSEYINSLFVRGDPMYKAANALCGFKRLLPQCRKKLELSSAYYKNWSKTAPRKQALPLKEEWVLAFRRLLIRRRSRG